METNNADANQIKITLPGDEDYLTQEAYKVLRTNLQFCGSDVKVIAFTSCNENEGKSTISLSVAKSFAELGKNVVFVDSDMRKSVLAGRNTDLKAVRSGLSEFLTGMSKISDTILKTQYPGLHVILSGQYPPNPVELLNSRYFSSLLSALREHYDYVILDTPPLGAVIDAAVVAAQCDGTVLVISEGKVRAHNAQSVVEQLQKSECKILGVVRNNIPKKGKSYYY